MLKVSVVREANFKCCGEFASINEVYTVKLYFGFSWYIFLNKVRVKISNSIVLTDLGVHNEAVIYSLHCGTIWEEAGCIYNAKRMVMMEGMLEPNSNVSPGAV